MQIFPFFLLHKRAKPILSPYLLPHFPHELKPYTPPLYPSLRPLSTNPLKRSLSNPPYRQYKRDLTLPIGNIKET